MTTEKMAVPAQELALPAEKQAVPEKLAILAEVEMPDEKVEMPNEKACKNKIFLASSPPPRLETEPRDTYVKGTAPRPHLP